MTLSMIVAIIMVIAIVVLLLKGVTNAGLVFATVSIIGALIMGYTFGDLKTFLGAGINTLGSTIFLMVFAILYFGILDEANVFKALTRWVMKHVGNNTIIVSMASNALAQLSILSGSGATCALCTLPPMRPVYEKMGMRNSSLMLVYTFGAGSLIFMPWCIAINEYSAYVNSDAMTMFNMLVPVIVFCFVFSYVIAAVVGVLEKRHANVLSNEEFEAMRAQIDQDTQVEVKNKKLMIFNTVFTLVIVATLFTGLTNPQILFALGLAVLLLVNYRSVKNQNEYFRRQAGRLIGIVITLLGLAMYLGVANKTGAFNDLANFLTAGVDEGLLVHLPFIICLLVVPLQIFLGNASPAIIVPTIAALAQPLGVDPVGFMAVYFAGHTVATNLCLFTPTPYLALELAGMDIKAQIKTQTVPCILYSWVVVCVGAGIGLIPF